MINVLSSTFAGQSQRTLASVNEYFPADLSARVAAYADEMRVIRRDLHAHPELSWSEVRTTRILRERLVAAGLTPRVLPTGTGLLCDIGEGPSTIAFRGDIDALPIQDEKDVPYRSTVPGVCHACGHDVHTTVTLGAALALADLAREGLLRRRVRMIFQPAEEKLPGGALDAVAAGALDGVSEIYSLHCDPKITAGQVGLRVGAITSACDRLMITLGGAGGHTARPHLTVDLVYALAKMATELPTALSRRVDPRSALSVVWGRIDSGSAPNAIPQTGQLEGTVRCLDHDEWQNAPDLVHEMVEAIAGAYGAKYEINYQRGVPPVVNDADATAKLRTAATAALGPQAVVSTEQSLGGEDFAWYLNTVSGAMFRLGVRGPQESGPRDLHQGSFDVDEHCIETGMKLFVATALLGYE